VIFRSQYLKRIMSRKIKTIVCDGSTLILLSAVQLFTPLVSAIECSIN